LRIEPLRIGGQLERGRLDFLSADPLLGGEVGDVGVDYVVQIVFGQRAGERVVERNLRSEVSFGGCRVKRHVGGIAQRLQRQQLGGRISRALGAEARARG